MNIDKLKIIPLQTLDPVSIPKRAKRADAVANRTLILSTAQRLFAEQGVANICMAAIAEAAGIGKGTLYRGFANKGELCQALMDEDMRVFQDEILQVFREKHDQAALVRLDAFLDHLLGFMEFHAPLLQEAQKQSAIPIDQTDPYMWLPWLCTTIGMLLQQAEQNGETHGLDIPYLVDAILAPLNARLFIYQREELGFDLERISRGLRRLVLDGCRKFPKLPPLESA